MIYKTNTPEVVKETVMEEFDSAGKIIKRTKIRTIMNDYISYDTYNTNTISNTDTFKNKSPIVNSSNGTIQISKANTIRAYGYSDSAKDTISNLNTEDWSYIRGRIKNGK